jgi:non-heme chloroperoxidase
MNKTIRNTAAALSIATCVLATGVYAASSARSPIVRTTNYIATRDAVQLYYKDWGPRNGAVVTLQPWLAAELR